MRASSMFKRSQSSTLRVLGIYMVLQQQQQKLKEPLFDVSMHVTPLLRIKKT